MCGDAGNDFFEIILCEFHFQKFQRISPDETMILKTHSNAFAFGEGPLSYLEKKKAPKQNKGKDNCRC